MTPQPPTEIKTACRWCHELGVQCSEEEKEECPRHLAFKEENSKE